MSVAARALLMLLICRGAVASDTVDHTFGKATAGQAIFVIGFDPKSPEVSTRGGLQFKHTEGPLDSQGIKTIFGIAGDGRAEIRFKVGKLTAPSQGWGSGVQLRLDFLDKQQSGITVARQIEPVGEPMVMVDFTSGGQEQHTVEKYPIGGSLISSEVSGLAIDRQGGMVAIEVLVKDQWVPLARRECSTAMIHPIAVWCGTGGGDAELDVTLQKILVTGADLATRGPEGDPPMTIWTMLMYASGGLLAASLLWNVRRRGGTA